MTTRSGWITALAMAAVLPLSALAGDTPPAAAAPATAAATATPEPASAEKSRKVEIRCESTASRIRRNKAEECGKSMQPTTNYYRHDLERTGETDMNKVLRNLDPRFQ